MRIRKHYAKLLLGTGRLNYSPPPSPPPPPFDQYQHLLSHAGGGAPCQLNCSPWDVLDFQNEEEEEEDYYGFEAGDETEEKAVTTSSVVDKCGDADRKKAKNKRRERSRKERKAKVNVVEEESTSTAIVVAEIARRCSKNNGKGWNCNRPSLPQQTLCDYHFYRLKKSKKKDNISHDIVDMETDPPPIYSENNEHSILSRLRERKPKKEY